MITPAQCKKIVDDILFDSFGVYHYVFLEEPIMLIGDHNFVFNAKFCREDALRIYDFGVMRANHSELIIMVTSRSSRLFFNVFFTDGALQWVVISKLYSPDFKKYTTEHSVPQDETIPFVTFTIRDEIGDRHQI